MGACHQRLELNGGAAGYALAVSLRLSRLRRRLPLLAAILFVLLCLFAVCAACACAVSNHPGQTIERVLAAMPAVLPASVAAVWTFAFAALMTVGLLVSQRQRAFGRASPAELQRFLF